jgi:hypothetical protein
LAVPIEKGLHVIFRDRVLQQGNAGRFKGWLLDMARLHGPIVSNPPSKH